MLVADASILESNARFPVFVSRDIVRKQLQCLFSPALHADIVELVFARFALLCGRHVDRNKVFL